MLCRFLPGWTHWQLILLTRSRSRQRASGDRKLFRPSSCRAWATCRHASHLHRVWKKVLGFRLYTAVTFPQQASSRLQFPQTTSDKLYAIHAWPSLDILPTLSDIQAWYDSEKHPFFLLRSFGIICQRKNKICIESPAYNYTIMKIINSTSCFISNKW